MDTASSIYILNDVDIRRSGSTRLMEVLRLVPGIQIQEKTYNKCLYAVRETVREDLQSVLFLIDGVPSNSYYTGVYQFHLHDIPLQQIDSIEVIKGPGGTIYGANANTGIISIYTKKPEETQGIFTGLEAGSFYYFSPFFRYGFKPSDNIYTSIYAKGLTTEGYPKNEIFDGQTVIDPATGSESVNKYPDNDVDNMRAASGGLNLQWKITNNLESLSMLKYSYTESDVYTQYSQHVLEQFGIYPKDSSPFVMKEWGQDFVASERLDYKMNNNHNIFINTYFKNNKQKTVHGGGIRTGVYVYEFEIQDNILLFDFNNISVGGNLRYVKYDADNPGPTHDVNYENPEKGYKLYAMFLQDKLNLGKYLDFTLGIKAETWTLVNNEPEFSPSGRLSFKPREDLVFWSAASRSITTPSYIQTNGEFRLGDASDIPPELHPDIPDGSPPNTYISVVRNRDVNPTEYITYELGTRTTLIPFIFLDISSFYAEYKDGIIIEINNLQVEESYVNEGQLNLTLPYENKTEGEIWGGEAIVKISPLKNIKTEISYSYFDRDDRFMSGDYFENSTPTESSSHVVRFRQYLDFPDCGLYFTVNFMWLKKHSRGIKYNYKLQQTSEVEIGGLVRGIYADPPEDDYKLDITVEKKMLDGRLRIFAWGKNLLADPHVESYTGITEYFPHTIKRYYGGGVSYYY